MIRQQLLETPRWSDRRIASVIGVSKNTAASVRKKLEKSGQIDHFERREDPRTGELTQPATKPPKSVFAKTEKEREELVH